MPTKYDDVNAICPFFQGSDDKKIRCEGVTNRSRLSIDFLSKHFRDKYREEFCNSDFQSCRICQMLEGKYE